jgi:hypothetical protein
MINIAPPEYEQKVSSTTSSGIEITNQEQRLLAFHIDFQLTPVKYRMLTGFASPDEASREVENMCYADGDLTPLGHMVVKFNDVTHTGGGRPVSAAGAFAYVTMFATGYVTEFAAELET